MGDTFRDINYSVIVNRSTAVTAINRVRQKGADTAQVLEAVIEFVEQSGNHEAGELLNQFNEELSKPAPRKGLLRRSWDALVSVLPTVTSVAGAVGAVAKLFS